jgi:site-specific DNA recombinase
MPYFRIESRDFGGRMGSLWAFLKDENNQRTLGWLGAGAVVVAGGLWALVTYFWPHHDIEAASPAVVCARRQGDFVPIRGGAIANQKRRPKTLFSRLLKCGVCGGGVSLIAPGQFGCQTARDKGAAVCTNGARMAVTALEETILGALRNHLLADPGLCAEFAAEYARHTNQLRAAQDAARTQQRAELAKVGRDLDRLVQALLDGVRGSQVKEKMAELEARKRKLEAELEQWGQPPVRLHPNMGERYRKEVTGLIDALNQPDRRTEAAELIRTLVDHIVFAPEEGSPKRATLDLHGDLAGILGLVSETGGKPPVTTLVAGAGFEPAAFRL